jgi:hypothetical protein
MVGCGRAPFWVVVLFWVVAFPLSIPGTPLNVFFTDMEVGPFFI